VALAEGLTVEPEALAAIARAADGSVRDGLSLLDQAIAQSDGARITAAQVADMLGVADRSMIFDLYEAVLSGRTADALAVTDRAHALGADGGALLGDMLELTHTLSRLKSVPDLRNSAELPELERTRGAAMADAASIPTLGRVWQMLLKGAAEVEAAQDRHAASEMVLIRLCHVAELPLPGDLVRRLSGQPAGASLATPPVILGGGAGPAMRASAAGGAALAPAEAAPAPAEETARAPVLASFRDVVALVASEREPMLHSHLLHSVHVVRFAPPVIELRPQPDAPRDLAARLGTLLLNATGTRWTIVLSKEQGQPTLAEQGNAADSARRQAAADHPLVRAIMQAFPGAKIEAVRDPGVDAYGLPVTLGEPDMPEFAPLEE
jgi:DNA polymerase-3 subunit gamma/tau